MYYVILFMECHPILHGVAVNLISSSYSSAFQLSVILDLRFLFSPCTRVNKQQFPIATAGRPDRVLETVVCEKL